MQNRRVARWRAEAEPKLLAADVATFRRRAIVSVVTVLLGEGHREVVVWSNRSGCLKSACRSLRSALG